MSRIEDDLLDCVIYLYPSVTDAETGVKAGGSGFLVSIPLEKNPGLRAVYAVTNSHVIRGGSPVIRLNTVKGDMKALDISANAWLHHPDGDDIAVVPLGLDANLFKFKMLPVQNFITDEIIDEFAIGPGDDVFLIGRFTTHEGKQRNLPSVRFGNIAMMPLEPILHPSGLLQESFLVEAHSINGYSGSPVFVHIPSFSNRPGKGGSFSHYGPWLLGVDWGHIQTLEPVKEADGETNVSEGWKVRSNSAMMGVVPAWKLRGLLDEEAIVMHRKQVDDQASKEKVET